MFRLVLCMQIAEAHLGGKTLATVHFSREFVCNREMKNIFVYPFFFKKKRKKKTFRWIHEIRLQATIDRMKFILLTHISLYSVVLYVCLVRND